ncbi:protein of unknown function [Acidithiobacillus ferrivorans]|uniref:Uncharacterized protein n=1 Tax=Acidithiobacillus ferrivorans TaxID=160808 RepID=A0ABY1MK55_9PROT|nr:protein of unknown function [Acidithiobacillus ferrivorans]
MLSPPGRRPSSHISCCALSAVQVAFQPRGPHCHIPVLNAFMREGAEGKRAFLGALLPQEGDRSALPFQRPLPHRYANLG